MNIIKPFREDIPMIDNWKPNGVEDVLFTNMKNFVVAPISRHMRLESDSLDYFMVKAKKCYNSQVMRDHLCKVLNYFERYFDCDREYLACLSHMKYMIDTFAWYNINNFMNDIRIYILSSSIKQKVINLAEHNYNMDLTYKNISAPLQYNNDHAKMMLEMSILMNCVIPLITHFAHKKRIGQIDEFIMDVYDLILTMFPADIFSKLYETAVSNVGKSEYKNAPLWAKQDIRGKDIVTHSRDSVDNIILNIMPKYAFERNIVALNFTSIQKNTSKNY